jgi:probable rRNA maturation factor
MVELLIRDEVRRLVPAALRLVLRRRLQATLRLLGRSSSEVALLFTGDVEIRALNRQYRGIDRATDVLSFHQQALRGEEDPAGDGVFLGDIVISAETALRRAAGQRLPGELARLSVHGLCHLFGHDHRRPVEAKRMRALENRLLRRTRGS